MVAEYWPETRDPAVIIVFKADSLGQMWAAFGSWRDVFDISINPAIEAKEGLAILKQVFPVGS